MTRLKSLNVSNNQLSGEIPRDLAFLDNLVHLDVSNNQFSGEFPLEFTRLQNRKGLKLNGNQVTTCVPPPLIASQLVRDKIGQVNRDLSDFGRLPVCR